MSRVGKASRASFGMSTTRLPLTLVKTFARKLNLARTKAKAHAGCDPHSSQAATFIETHIRDRADLRGIGRINRGANERPVYRAVPLARPAATKQQGLFRRAQPGETAFAPPGVLRCNSPLTAPFHETIEKHRCPNGGGKSACCAAVKMAPVRTSSAYRPAGGGQDPHFRRAGTQKLRLGARRDGDLFIALARR